MYPSVSVVIPTRDRPKQLFNAIDSVCNQSIDNYEIIIVDDASRQDITSVVNEFSREKMIKLIRHDFNLGASKARNTGLLYAQGEFVAFLDDDDRWLPRKLEQQLNCIRSNHEVSVVGCGFSFEIAGKELKSRIPVLPKDPCRQLLWENWIGSTSIPLIRKDRLVAVGGFDTSLPSCQDWDVWLRLSRQGAVAIVPEILVARSIHEGQMTTDISRKIDGRKRLLEKHRIYLDQHPRCLAKQCQRIGTLSLLAGDRTAARGYFMQAINAWRTDYISHVGRFMSMFPSGLVQNMLKRIAVEKIGNYHLYH